MRARHLAPLTAAVSLIPPRSGALSAVYHVCDNTLSLEKTALDAHPELKAWMARMAALPAMAAYLAERPASGIGAADGGVGMPGSLMATASP